MYYILVAVVFGIGGFIAGALVYRNNLKKIEEERNMLQLKYEGIISKLKEKASA